MHKKDWLIAFIALLLFQVKALGQATQPLSTFASRFNFFADTASKSVWSHPLGYHLQQPVGFLVCLKTREGVYTLPLSPLPDASARYLPTGIGSDAAGLMFSCQNERLRIVLHVQAARGPCAGPQDTAAFKFLLAPGFLVDVAIEAYGQPLDTATLVVALNRQGQDPVKETNLSWWRFGKAIPHISFPLGQGSSYTLSQPGEQGKLLQWGSFTGFSFGLKNIAVGSPFNQSLAFSGFTAEPALRRWQEPGALRFAYHRYFASGAAVGRYILDQKARYDGQDFRSMRKAGGLLSLVLHSDAANNFLVEDERTGQLRFLQSEGEFRYLSTLDVSLESEWAAWLNPWRLRNQIEQWAAGHTFSEQRVPSQYAAMGAEPVREGASAADFGPLLWHDLGAVPYFYGKEAYDFGPFMPVEQNTSWALLLYQYYHFSQDTAFVRSQASLLEALMRSLINRDGNNNGLADQGAGWSTFDVSENLKTAPDNVYLGIKQACAYLAAARLLRLSIVDYPALKLGPGEKDIDGTTAKPNEKVARALAGSSNRALRERQAKGLEAEADKIFASILKEVRRTGLIPATLNRSRQKPGEQISVAADGALMLLAFPNPPKALTNFLSALKPYQRKAFSACTRPWGMALTSTEPVTWFSKASSSDYVWQLMGEPSQNTDAAAWRWNQTSPKAYQDGAVSLTEAWPGNVYPRGGIYLFGWLKANDLLHLPAKEGWRKMGLK